MPTGIFDIHERCEVLHPQEIAAGEAQCREQGIDYIPQGDGAPLLRVCDYAAMLTKRWNRAVATAQLIDNIKAGYCTIMPKDSAPLSDARH